MRPLTLAAALPGRCRVRRAALCRPWRPRQVVRAPRTNATQASIRRQIAIRAARTGLRATAGVNVFLGRLHNNKRG